MNNFFEQYSAFENGLIRRFGRHPLWRGFSTLSNDIFVNLLLQLGHLSNNFVGWYEQAKQGLTREDAKEVLRVILRDEIPRDLPTHQDDRLFDLMQIGVAKERALNTRASATTDKTVRRLRELVRYPQPDHDLRVMVTLRIAGEVLVAETYRHVVPALTTRFGIAPEASRFYYPHWVHDEKDADGHTDSFDALLSDLITNERTLAVAKEAAEEAYAVRAAFYDQFTTRHRVMRGVVRVLQVAAVLMVVLVGARALPLYQAASHGVKQHEWSEFLASLAPEARQFYVDCDKSLVARAARESDTDYLEVIGTAQACKREWGPGP